MQKILSIIFIFTWVNSISQDQDSIGYDSNLIGDWELRSYVTMNYDGTVKDTFLICLDSVNWNVYFNVILRIESDSVREQMIPTGKQKDSPIYDEKCQWSIELKEESSIWINIPCGQTVKGLHEIIFVSEQEMHMIFYFQERTVIGKFSRIDSNKL